jgi:hypothetical protein
MNKGRGAWSLAREAGKARRRFALIGVRKRRTSFVARASSREVVVGCFDPSAAGPKPSSESQVPSPTPRALS